MAQYVWKHLPYAIYLDTNVLRSAGPYLDAQWINELLSITNQFGISLCISELVLTEWCEHIMGVLESNRKKLLSSISLLKHHEIQLPDINQDEVNLPEKSQLIELMSKKLKGAGFNVIENWDAPLSHVLTEAVAKKPPFEEGGRGLCDAVILESYVKHAIENFAEARVLVISNDGAVKRSEERFKRHGITVHFISDSDIVGKLKTFLKDEVADYIEEKKSRLKEYIMSYESTILDFVRETPLEITDWMLNPPFGGIEDRIYGTIESILSLRPTKIIDVIGGAPAYGIEMPADRYPVQIFVEIELDILVKEYGLGVLMQTRAVVQPNMLDEDTPVTLEHAGNYQPQSVVRTIKRSITVHATIDAEKEKQDVFDGFRIERLI